ncbi:MAG: hypothetical protein HY074_03050, partial [Deltaproteobacteria bacterium]|nr:hypothetical protein [Deltaproteobacteria bacterium]
VWSVDLTAPVATITQVDPAVTITNRTDATFTFAANESATFECSLDGGVFQSCVSPFSDTGLAEGQHTLGLRPTDVAGNVGSVVSYLWTVDLTAPVILQGNVVPAPGVTNASSMSVEFTAAEPVTFTCSLDGAPAVACLSPFTAAVTTEGAHTIVVNATDLAGNVALPLTLNWTMDFTAPQISFGSMTPSAASYINTTSLTLNVNATEPVYYSGTLDNLSLSNVSSPIQLTNLTEGFHSLQLTAVDVAGNPANTITHNFVVDLTAPVVHFTDATAAGITNQTSNSISFAASESVTFQCNFNSTGFTACASPFTVSGLVEGTEILQVQATDLAGNMSTIVSYFWRVDLTPPKTTIGAATPAGALINSASVAIAFSVDDATATSQCSRDGSTFTACASPYALTALADGSHTVTIRSMDSAGNVESAPPTYTFTVDTKAPTITFVSNVGTLSNSSSVRFTFTASEAATFDCSIDGVTTRGCASPATYTSLVDGAHAFSVVAHDLAGNASTPASFSWSIDTSVPVVNLTSMAVWGTTNQTGNSFTFTVSKPATVACAVDGVYAPCGSPDSVSGLANGTHTFTARATDQAGNVGNSALFSWTIDTTTPVTSISASQAANNGSSISFTLTSSKSYSTFVCALDGAAPVSCDATASYSNLAAGNHSFFARATDALGNVDPTGASYAFTVVVPLTTAITSANPSQSPTSQTSITFTFAASDAAATFQCSLDGAAAAACASPMSYSGLVNATHTFLVQAVKGAQVDEIGASYTWQVDNTLPLLLTVSTSVTSTTATVNWTTNKPTTTMLEWGLGTDTSQIVPEGSVYSTTHSVTLTGLLPSTGYSFKIAGHDIEGNFLLGSRRVFKTNP